MPSFSYVKNFLFANKLWSDTISLSWKAKLFIGTFLALSIVFSFVDLNHFSNSTKPLSVFSVWNDVSTFKQVGLICSAIASITGVLSSTYIAFKKLSNFFWTFIFAISYGIFAFSRGVYGDGQMAIVILFSFNLYGWYRWVHNIRLGKPAMGGFAPLTWKVVAIWSVVLGAVFVGLWFEVPALYNWFNGTDSYPYKDKTLLHVVDAIIPTLAGVGSVMFYLKKLGFAPLWIGANTFRILLFAGAISSSIVNINLAIVWVLFLSSAVLSFISYHHIFNKNKPLK